MIINTQNVLVTHLVDVAVVVVVVVVVVVSEDVNRTAGCFEQFPVIQYCFVINSVFIRSLLTYVNK